VLRITFGSKIKEAGNLKYYQGDRRKAFRQLLWKQVVRMRGDEIGSTLCKIPGFVYDIPLLQF
jgi:hypothetical protein